MLLKSINTFVHFEQFGVTAGIAGTLILGILAFNRNPAGYSRRVRAIVSAIAAMGIAPSIIRLIELPLIVSPAAIWILIGVSGEAGLADGLKYGFAPWLITCVLINEVWKRCAKPRAKGES